MTLQAQLETNQASHTRHLIEAAQLRQELRQLSSRLELAESDQQHLEATCKQAVAAAEADWAKKVAFRTIQTATAFSASFTHRPVKGRCVSSLKLESRTTALQHLATTGNRLER